MQKILIVDDDPNIVLLVQMALVKEGQYEIITANNGIEAIEAIKKDKPDLILLDLMMPGMDGFEVCKQIKQNDETRFIPVIMITAKSDIADKLFGMEIGANDYVTKPFNPVELLARVKSHLRIRELEVELAQSKQLETALQMTVTLQHEINNPLTGIIGNMELLKEWKSLSDDEVKESVDDALTMALRIKDIVAKANQLTKVTSTTYVKDSRMIDLNMSIGDDSES